jgi:hypothetical protein
VKTKIKQVLFIGVMLLVMGLLLAVWAPVGAKRDFAACLTKTDRTGHRSLLTREGYYGLYAAYLTKWFTVSILTGLTGVGLTITGAVRLTAVSEGQTKV